MINIKDICIVVACNDEACLERNLMASDLVKQGVPVHVERNAQSASIAYNRGLDATSAPIVIFSHQDVYFPPDWETRLADAIMNLEKLDPNWALLAPFGMTKTGEHIGEVWTTSLSRLVGRPVTNPEPAESFDELVIIMRRESELRFDENLPLFHLYGTDIVQTAILAGKGAWVGALALVHNDGFHDQLRSDFTAAYHFVRHKWKHRLPVRTPVLWIRKHGLDLIIHQLRLWKSVKKRAVHAGDTNTDPRVFSTQCGWEEPILDIKASTDAETKSQ